MTRTLDYVVMYYIGIGSGRDHPMLKYFVEITKPDHRLRELDGMKEQYGRLTDQLGQTRTDVVALVSHQCKQQVCCIQKV